MQSSKQVCLCENEWEREEEDRLKAAAKKETKSIKIRSRRLNDVLLDHNTSERVSPHYETASYCAELLDPTTPLFTTEVCHWGSVDAEWSKQTKGLSVKGEAGCMHSNSTDILMMSPQFFLSHLSFQIRMTTYLFSESEGEFKKGWSTYCTK